MLFQLISTSASQNSQSRRCLPDVMNKLSQAGIKHDLTDIRDLPPVWVNNRELQEYPLAYRNLYNKIENSDAVIFLGPVYNYTFSSGLKAISEIIGDALERKPVMFILAAGAVRSHLVVSDIVKSMTFEQSTICFPDNLLITELDLDDYKLTDDFSKRLVSTLDNFILFSRRNSGNSCMIFPELYVQSIKDNIKFFTDVLGFTLIRDENDFAELKLNDSILLLNAYADDVEGHFFHNKINQNTNGIGVEIGIFVNDIETIYHKAKESNFYREITPLKEQAWKMIDFRIVTHDNYYLRVTQRIFTSNK
jgi:NAD(P)H-dependent FMN reductase